MSHPSRDAFEEMMAAFMPCELVSEFLRSHSRSSPMEFSTFTCPIMNYTAEVAPESLPDPTPTDLLSVEKIEFNAGTQQLEKHPAQAWSQEEDDMLSVLYKKHGPKEWPEVAYELNLKYNNNRTNTQCSQHYNRVLNTTLNKGEWTREEDARLKKALTIFGKNKWREIAHYISNRSDVEVRYRAKKLFPAYFE